MRPPALQVGTLLVWHLPALYDTAVDDDAIHGAEHLTLLLTAVALWAALDAIRGDQGGLAVVALFLVSFPPLFLGVAMTFATTAWYPPYAAAGPRPSPTSSSRASSCGPTAAWPPSSGGVYLFVRWLRDLERVSPGRPGRSPPDLPWTPMPSC